MPPLTEYCKKRLSEVSLLTLLPAQTEGAKTFCKCPKCGADGKKNGLRIVDKPGKQLVKCSSCGFGAGGSIINIIMKMYDYDFKAATEKISDMSGVQLEYDKPHEERKSQITIGSFCARQLAESGLTAEDVMATVKDGDDTLKISPFRTGSLDVMTGKVDNLADEMLILYYDLEGRRRKYVPAKNKSREVEYTRVRWSNPEAHTRRGKAVKYQTPAGAKSEIYIPEKVRAMYRNKQQFDTLFIQEGEKKAEKACKHGLMSVAIQGIGNIGRADEGLPPDIQYLVQKCSVRNIVFLMDGDWNDLKKNLQDDDRADQRPRDFARALIKFKKFIGTLSQCGIHVDIWFAHVNKNEQGDKGVDDLLTNSLKGREAEFRQSIEEAMTAHDGKARWADCMNITSWSDSKILSLWCLNNKEDFFDLHREQLTQLHSFKFDNVFYKVDNGVITVATEYGTGEEFWTKTIDDKGKTRIEADLIKMLGFLEANGFRSMKTDDNKRAFVKVEQGIIQPRDEHEVRKFILSYVTKATRDHSVQLFFYETIASKLSVSNLSLLDILVTNAGKPTQDAQRFYFKNAELTITDSGVAVDKLTGPVWQQNLVQREFQRIKIFDRFEKVGDDYEIILTNEGRECEFMKYIERISNFWKGREMNSEQKKEFAKHIANKITCIGYLLRDFKKDIESKAVICMDGAMSEVGQSNGRSGKSLIGKAISKFVSQAYIGMKNTANDDQYLFSSVTRQTKNIFLDDIQISFDIGRFFPYLTGDLNVNVKNAGRFCIPYEEAPKFLITTNHALDNLDNSAKARTVFMSFSPWYSIDFSPNDDFGHMFFSDWDERQWNLFDNLMAESVMIYEKAAAQGWKSKGCGAIDPPMEGLEKRALRQEMGELFLQWADQYFNPRGGVLNQRISRKVMYENYLAEFGQRSTAGTAKQFRARIIAFCKYNGYHLNANKRDAAGKSFIEAYNSNPYKTFIGDRDLSQSLEYFTVYTTDYLINTQS